MKKIVNAGLLVAGLTVGNFIYESSKGRRWGEAAKISFFQAVAIATYLIIDNFSNY